MPPWLCPLPPELATWAGQLLTPSQPQTGMRAELVSRAVTSSPLPPGLVVQEGSPCTPCGPWLPGACREVRPSVQAAAAPCKPWSPLRVLCFAVFKKAQQSPSGERARVEITNGPSTGGKLGPRKPRGWPAEVGSEAGFPVSLGRTAHFCTMPCPCTPVVSLPPDARPPAPPPARSRVGRWNGGRRLLLLSCF